MANSNGNSKSKSDFPVSYSRYTKKDIDKLGLKVRVKPIFQGVSPMQPSDWLTATLQKAPKVRLATEKAKSEFLIAPLLLEIESLNPNEVGVFSGYNFEIDPEKGLTGFCDYILSSETHSPDIESPVFFIVEAKNENLELGTPQCIAEMYAARLLNERSGNPNQPIFGAVTFGKEWRFFQLEEDTVWRDPQDYQIADLSQILGILQFIVDNS